MFQVNEEVAAKNIIYPPRFYKPKKIPVSLRLDNDIVLFFKKLASGKKVPYQTLINAFLRKELQAV